MNQMGNIWNWNYIQESSAREHHYRQMAQGIECVNKLRDLLNAMDQVEPAYQPMVISEMGRAIQEHYKRKTYGY